MFRCVVLFIAVVAAPVWGYGQQTDTAGGKVLKDAVIKGKHKRNNDPDFVPGQKVTHIDSITLQQYQAQSVATLLSQQVPVFIKSYGFNGLATLNFRGSSAAQSQVYWNGVPLQNAALGMTDVSTLPVMFMNKVDVAYGGSAALLGSGNIGGAVLLNSEDIHYRPLKSLSVSGSTGSFGQYSGGLSASMSNAKWHAGIKGLYQYALNNFRFTANDGSNQKMSNGQLRGAGLMADVWRLIRHNKGAVSAQVWVQHYDRGIPPALFESASVKQQYDQSLRALVLLSPGANDKYMVRVISSLIKDEIKYDDEAIALHTNNSVFQYYQKVSVERYLQQGRHHFSLFSPVQIAWMHMPVSNLLKAQNKAAIAGAYEGKYFDNKLNVSASARLETFDTASFVAKGTHYLLPGANAAYQLLPWLRIRANVQRSYRVPTLNELFYYPGGNTTLKPEQGWSEDAGYTVKHAFGKLDVFHDVSVFNRNINDWIIWLGGAVWTPHNIAAVHSRGVETENKVTYTTGKWKLHLGLNTAYVLATTTKSYLYNDGSVGKQIPYSPRYNGQLNAGFTYKRLYVNYNHTYTGYRFTVSDESAWLAPYTTGNVQAMYTAYLGKHALQLTAQCNNIWNERYTVVFGRPMPGINFLAGFKAEIL
jgi:vitamin B12 transporter